MTRISHVRAVYFSATGNTKKVVERIASGVANILDVPMTTDDFTRPPAREHLRLFAPTDLVIFGTPTYAGRVPNKVLPFIKNLFHGNKTLCVPVVTFGNRSYDEALKELSLVLARNGMRTIGAVAAACPHAFADIGTMHPNDDDAAVIAAFIRELSGRIMAAKEQGWTMPRVYVSHNPEIGPYYTPLKLNGAPAKFLKAKPKTDSDKCTHCGQCAKGCPMGAIDFHDITNITGTCIKCQACVKNCPQHAKYFDDPDFLSHKAYLEKHYQDAACTVIKI